LYWWKILDYIESLKNYSCGRRVEGKAPSPKDSRQAGRGQGRMLIQIQNGRRKERKRIDNVMVTATHSATLIQAPSTVVPKGQATERIRLALN
jgi:hypothetical protein